MIRIVRSPGGGVQIDSRGNTAGRGAYLCANASCWERALAKGHLERALRTKLTSEERAGVQAQIDSFAPQDTQAVVGDAP